jgi:hypothetical protein
MTSKLTLSIDDRVIVSAKKYAKGKGESLSGLVENYLKSISTRESGAGGISPRVQKMMGRVKLPKGFDYKKELGNALARKHVK